MTKFEQKNKFNGNMCIGLAMGAGLERITFHPNPFKKLKNLIRPAPITRRVLNNRIHTRIHRINEYPTH